MQVIKSLPRPVYVALSGGVDSVVLLDFLVKKKHNVTAVHYIHDNEYAASELKFVSTLCDKKEIKLITDDTVDSANFSTSKEEKWRNDRYSFFKTLDGLVCTGHTLDDVVEWYLFTSLNGDGKLMDYSHANVVRPLIATKKADILEYADRNSIDWLEDPSNADTKFATRNLIRHELLPTALKVNPGLYSTLKNKLLTKMFR